jgi:hypothetical protein
MPKPAEPIDVGLEAMASRLDMHPRVVKVLMASALKSDHEGIQKQIADLLVITKMTHPEAAAKEAAQIAFEEKLRIQEERQKREQALAQMDAYRRQEQREKDVEARLGAARHQNLLNAQKVVDELYDKIKGGLSFDRLGYQEQSLVGAITDLHGNHIERGGFLWFKVTWTGPTIQLDRNHELYEWLKKNRFALFAEEPKRVSHGFYTRWEE